MLRNLLLATYSISVLTACQKSGLDNSSNGGQTILNVSYGPDPQQKMDVYLPAGRAEASTKVLVLIHGGAWSTGDKSDFTPFVDSIKKRSPEYAIFNINYRLSTGTANTFPAQENDVKLAVEFIVSKSAEYKVSQSIALVGGSNGGHLYLFHVYK